MEEFDAVLTGNSKWAVVRADCKDAANSLPENCLDGAIIDPPAGISFMASSSRTWDSDRGGRDKWIAWLTERLQAIYRALKPGAHILVWSLPRTSAWTGIAVEDAGFEVRDVISHLFGCLTPDTEVLCESKTGEDCWVQYTSLKVGNKVLCWDSEDDTYSWDPVQEILTYVNQGTMFHIHGQGTDQLVTKNHRCPVEREPRKYQFIEAQELKGTIRVPVIPDLHGMTDITPTIEAMVDPVTYTGIVWCIRVPTGAFVARRNGKVFVTGNSGFPKSMNISKKLDQMDGAEREVLGPNPTQVGRKTKNTSYLAGYTDKDGQGGGEVEERQSLISAPSTPEAKKWEGWGTALKPSQEMWWLGRKPISESTLALNILKWGVGALNIDKTRVPHANAQDLAEHEKMVQAIKTRGGSMEGSWKNSSDLSGASDVNLGGRWPSNLVLSHSPECKCVGTQKVKGIVGGTSPRGIGFSGIEGTGDMPTAFNYADSEGMETVESWECAPGCPVAEMNAQSGSSSSPQSYQRNTASGNVNSYSPGIGDPAGKLSLNYGDKGGASRFFPVFSHDPTLESDLNFAPFLYTPKPSKSEKNKGCENLPIPTTTVRIREGLTQTEKEWVLAELKRCGVPL